MYVFLSLFISLFLYIYIYIVMSLILVLFIRYAARDSCVVVIYVCLYLFMYVTRYLFSYVVISLARPYLIRTVFLSLVVRFSLCSQVFFNMLLSSSVFLWLCL